MKNQTIQRIIEIPLEEVRSDKYNDNVERLGDHSDTCFICGKRIKDLSKAKNVHYLTNGSIVSYSGEDIEGSQGAFPVGSDCAKKLVINFTF